MCAIVKGVFSIAVIVFLFSGCTEKEVTDTDETGFSAANGVNGGRIYDQFWVAESGFSQSDSVRYNQYADFFRCKQCHGWDLQGRAGSYANRAPTTKRPNVADVDLTTAAAEPGAELFHLIKTGDNPAERRSSTADLSAYDPASNSTLGDKMPNYAEILSDRQIWDLVKFLKTEAVAGNLLYDRQISGSYPSATITYSNIGSGGDVAAGNAVYATKCSGCHGADGKKILVDGDAYSVGKHIRSKPYEDVHKIKFGVLGSCMNCQSLTLQQLKDLYAALADTTSYPNPEIATANDSLGGRLYDKFWSSKAGFSQSDTALIKRLNQYADFFRCQQCHGFDLSGRAGTYANRVPSTKRPNVADVNLLGTATKGSTDIFHLIKTGADSTKRRSATADLSTYNPASNFSEGDKMPNYAALLSDKQIWDLVKFLKTGYMDGKLLYDCSISGTYPNAVVTCTNIGKDGNAAAGTATYATNCKSCHGTDGKKILVDGKSFSVGSHLRAKAYEDVHKIRFHLYGEVPKYSLQQMKDLLKALVDTTVYLTPTKDDSICYSSNGINGGRMYDQFWAADTTFNQTDTARYNQYADFFRCKQCHGWDLLGRAGGYANRAPSTKRPNVALPDLFATASKTTTALFHLIKTGDDSTKRRAAAADLSTYDPVANSTVGDQMPNYGAIFSDKQIWEFVKFFKNEIFDVKQLYDFTVTGAYPTATIQYSNIGKDGKAASGNTFYTANCLNCHGADGKKILVDGNTYSVGSHVRAKPYEDVHKIKYGVLGSTMKNRSISLQQMKDLYKALADTTVYPNP